MKKFIVLTITLLLVFSLVACKNNTNYSDYSEDTDTEFYDNVYYTQDNTNYSEDTGTKFYDNVYYTIDEYLSAWRATQTNPKRPLYMYGNNDEKYTIIPKLMTNEYELYNIVADLNTTIYYYEPSEPDESFDDNTISVSIWEGDGSYILLSSEQPTETDGIAYNSKYNYWVIDHNSRKIAISFPDSIVLQSEEELGNYFTFEEIAYNP